MLTETAERVVRAVRAGNVDGIEYRFNEGVKTLSDADALLGIAKGIAAREETGWYPLWIASLSMFLGRREDARTALRGADAFAGDARLRALRDKFEALFGFAPWYEGWSEHRCEHFTWRNVPDADFIDRREAAYRDIRAFFGCEPERGIDVFVWRSRDEARRLLGRPLGFAIPQYFLIHTATDQSPGHEIAHIFAHSLPGAGPKSALIAEGVAVLLDGTGADRLRAAAFAMKKRGVSAVALAGLWRDFSACPWEVSYPVAGYFCQTLLARLGKDAFLDVVRNQTYECAAARLGRETVDSAIAQAERDLEGAAGDFQKNGFMKEQTR